MTCSRDGLVKTRLTVRKRAKLILVGRFGGTPVFPWSREDGEPGVAFGVPAAKSADPFDKRLRAAGPHARRHSLLTSCPKGEPLWPALFSCPQRRIA